MPDGIYETSLPGLTLLRRGKVRDVYQLGPNLLLVATDRVSAFDSVLPTPIPDKGKVLTALSHFWFSKLSPGIPNHLVTAQLDAIPELGDVLDVVSGRSMVVRPAEVLPIEFVVRGYIFGTAFSDYLQDGTTCGIKLPPGLRLAEKLPEPILTPATKSTEGHDINITHQDAINQIGSEAFQRAKDLSFQIFNFAKPWLEARGLFLCDTKFEFGYVDGDLILVDEVLTPDSSRLWWSDAYVVGQTPVSIDKQFIREHLLKAGWNKTPPAPALPEDVVRHARSLYLDAYRVITDHELEPVANDLVRSGGL